MVPARQADVVAHRLPHAEVARLRSLGHLAHEEAPERVAATVLDWFDRVTALPPRRSRRSGQHHEGEGPMTAPLRHPVPVDDRRPHAIVIGSGFGGLAAAIRLGARGYRVTVLERHDQPAGAPACSGRTVSPSMPARPSSPRPSSSRTCGRSAASASPTMSTWSRSTPSTACASTTARRSTARVTRTGCAPRSASSRPPMSRATTASWRRARRSAASASSSWATCPSAPSWTWCASRRTCSGSPVIARCTTSSANM